jgi:hypothetical protein
VLLIFTIRSPSPSKEKVGERASSGRDDTIPRRTQPFAPQVTLSPDPLTSRERGMSTALGQR